MIKRTDDGKMSFSTRLRPGPRGGTSVGAYAVSRLLLRAKNESRITVENVVKEPQKPTERLTNRGNVFLVARCACLAAAGSMSEIAPTSSEAIPPLSSSLLFRQDALIWRSYVGSPHSFKNSMRSSARKPMIRLPAKLTQMVGKRTGAPG
ncbi:hypothetical protein B0J13DRAFT_168661 [Dactylonectria estremocensis]|uniref:Uncharacterized protein n=1 Tax=Dactylonectria estremocensis TaxID=1079267 RepID=A0A9P9FB84_9HYPO|nr:hypothetical protein B0J13DRAFT_168661 [Dactylonectria estremocensis]